MKRVPRFQYLALTGAALLLAGSITPARAQADPDDVKRAVARISVMDGDVSVRRGDSGDWVAAVINAPLLAGDQVATAANSRAEVQLDAANALRMGGDASVNIAQLEYDRYQFEIARGTVTYRVLRPSSISVELDTQNLAVRPSKQGIYRLRVTDSGESEITVRAGSVEVSTASGSQWVNAGQTLMARGSASDPEFQIVAAIPVDAWDRWSESRDAAELNSPSSQYVPDGVYGAEDLDRYGTWSNVPDYGNVWQPANVGPDWSPYSSGQWTWEDWYGWTWVSYDPWGWAPYHYGRWFYRDHFGWAWYPGARFGRHYWSPALVGFFGWGGAGFGMGSIGWVPLAPYEVFHPWWGRSYYGRYGNINRNINISSVNISNIYRNAGVRNGINGVSGADFQAGRFHAIGHYTGTQIREARIVQGGMPIAPGSANLRFSERQAAVAPRAAANTHFFTREQPRPVERIPFAQQQRAFQDVRAGNGGGVTGRESATPRAAGPAEVRQGAPAQQQPAQAGGWRRFADRPPQDAAPAANRNTPAQSEGRSLQNPAARTNEAPAQQNRSGWQRFGAPGAGTETQAAPRGAQTQPAPQAAQPAPQSDRNGWNRFGSPGATPNGQRQQTAPPVYRSYPAPGNQAPQSRPAPAQQQQAPPAYRSNPAPSYRAPQSSPPPASRQSAPQSSGGGGSSRSSGSSSSPRGGHGR